MSDPTIAVARAPMIHLTARDSAEIRALRRAGMDITAIVIAMRRYRGVQITGSQVAYHLRKTKTKRPRVSRGRVFSL